MSKKKHHSRIIRELVGAVGLRPSDRLVLAILGHYVNKDMSAWPGTEQLAIDCDLHVQTVKEALTSLVRVGAIEVVRPGSRTRRAVYRVLSVESLTGVELPTRARDRRPTKYRKPVDNPPDNEPSDVDITESFGSDATTSTPRRGSDVVIPLGSDVVDDAVVTSPPSCTKEETEEEPITNVGTARTNTDLAVVDNSPSTTAVAETTNKTCKHDDDVITACQLLADLIEDNGSKRPAITCHGWHTDMERLHRIDERTWEQITAAIRWCQDDNFWHTNILSPAKLRKQYDQMRLQAQAQQGPGRKRAEPQPRSGSWATEAHELEQQQQSINYQGKAALEQ